MNEYVYNESEWKSLSLTLVEYPRNDVFGKFMAILALAPLYIIATFSTISLRCRDLHTIFYFIGILLNEALNMTLKYLIKEPRPAVRDNYYVQFGMPSSHSQFMLFFTTYSILFLFKRLHQNSLVERIFRGIIVILMIIVTALICYGRLYLMYHTLSQVIVGAIIGFMTALIWFVFVHSILTPYVFPKIVSWRISEILLIRDTSLIPNIVFFEYTATRQESRARLRKNMKMQ
ncbi:hypothetical protein PVAND_004007 [Polypedilum vanderplanki]|uniref:Dolichyldiphosphatase 1 n=1 Tax=Polypedilum vanderplanki TaxID=319348 RepID=A0A9J6BXS4_POLVA|nr:hypothetical protein PVAND_004007 [Polypedilum vanderplanki]